MFKSKTMIFAVLLATFGALELQMQAVRRFLLPLLGEAWTGFALIVVAVIVAVLRVLTIKPLSEK